MKKTTEEDVIIYHESLIEEVCKIGYYHLEREDCYAEARLALLHAIRTYSPKYGPFSEYAMGIMQKKLKQKNNRERESRRAEASISINEPISKNNNDNSYTLEMCFGQNYIDDTGIHEYHFIQSLPKEEQIIILLRLYDFSIQEISFLLYISIFEVQSILKRIGEKLDFSPNLMNRE